MGRPRISSKEHELRGTKPTASAPEKAAKMPAGRPKMPSGLSPAARKEWRRIVPLLEERGTLSAADSVGLALYAETFSRWLDAQREIKLYGITLTQTVLDRSGKAVESRKINPALRVAENCERSMRAFLREFGCTPQSREKVQPAKKREEDEPLPADSVGALYPDYFKEQQK